MNISHKKIEHFFENVLLKLKIKSEFAQVFPNPNPLGKAYIDDFESSKITSYISMNFADWKKSSRIFSVNDCIPADI